MFNITKEETLERLALLGAEKCAELQLALQYQTPLPLDEEQHGISDLEYAKLGVVMVADSVVLTDHGESDPERERLWVPEASKLIEMHGVPVQHSLFAHIGSPHQQRRLFKLMLSQSVDTRDELPVEITRPQAVAFGFISLSRQVIG